MHFWFSNKVTYSILLESCRKLLYLTPTLHKQYPTLSFSIMQVLCKMQHVKITLTFLSMVSCLKYHMHGKHLNSSLKACSIFWNLKVRIHLKIHIEYTYKSIVIQGINLRDNFIWSFKLKCWLNFFWDWVMAPKFFYGVIMYLVMAYALSAKML